MARLEVYPETISGRVTETGANTFTQVQVILPSSLFRGIGSRTVTTIELISFTYTTGAQAVIIAAIDAFQVQLTTNSRAAMGGLNENSTLYHQTYSQLPLGTVASYSFFDHLKEFHFGGQGGRGILIASPNIFVAINGSSLSAAQTVDFKLNFRLVTIDAVRFSRLLTNQVAAT